MTNTSRNIGINLICVLAGAALLLGGIAAPKQIFAMIDKKEVDTLYVREADVAYLDDTSSLTMEEKLDLLDWRATGTHVSSSYPDNDSGLYIENEDLRMKVAAQLEAMQQLHLLPEFDFDVRNIDTIGMNYESLVNLEDMNQYMMLVYMTYQVSDDYLYLVVDAETGKILEYSVYAYITPTEWAEMIETDLADYMAEELGVSKSVILEKYQYGIYNATKNVSYVMDSTGKLENQELQPNAFMDDDEDVFVQIGFWVSDQGESIEETFDYYDAEIVGD